MSETKLLRRIEAMAEAAIQAGSRFPITAQNEVSAYMSISRRSIH